MSLYTETGSARVYTVTNDLIGDTKVLDTINDGVSPVLARLLSSSQTFNPVSHRIAVKKSRNTNQGSFSGMDVFPTALSDTRVSARFEPRAVEQSVPISGLEKDINALSGGQGMNLEAVEIGSAALDFANLMSDQIFLDGTGNGGKDIIGLELAVDGSGTYANVNRSTYATWASSEYSISAASHSASIANSDNGFNLLRRMLFGGTDSASNTITRTIYGSMVPNAIVMPITLWPAFEALYQMVQSGSAIGQGVMAMYAPMVGRSTINRYGQNQAPSEVMGGRAGFNAITYMGIPLIWDEHCPAGTIYFLNFDTMQWLGIPSTSKGAISYDLLKGPVKFEGANTNVTAALGVNRLPAREPFAQYGEATYFTWHGALRVNPKYNGKVNGTVTV